MSLGNMTHRDLDTHVRVLGWVHIGGELISVAIGFFVLTFFVGIGLAADDSEAAPILATIGTTVCGFFFLFAIPGIIAGIGLLRRRPWSRPLALLVGFLDLMAFPFGTAIGLYTFYVLLQRAAPDYFDRVAHEAELADEYDDYDDDFDDDLDAESFVDDPMVTGLEDEPDPYDDE